ncbi:MAG TPA: GYD domain-containing protein [Chloroflexota bacterium]|nr:GYD domain-containing protein [Chloroflexota bacterium]
MSRFLIQFAYTPEAWQAMVKNPTDREAAFRGLAEQMGATFISLDYCFGDYDGVVIFEAPDSKTALSIVLAAVTPGHLKATRTTELFTMQEMTDALKKAGGVHYPAPGR